MQTAAGEIAPGMNEYAIAGVLAEECYLRSILPLRVLVATDDRVHRYRHVPPTDKTLEQYVALTLVARRYGLTVSLTRLVHFGPVPDELRRRAVACAQVDAVALAATRPGASASTILARIQAAYATNGFAEEWQHYHQGGAIGYELREWLATPESSMLLQAGQAVAWNPSISGVMMEDTLLVGEHGPELLTSTACWPTQAVDVDGLTLERPGILEVH
jgi:antitoxin VapB